MHYDEFIPKFEKQYPEFPWSSVQVSHEVLRWGPCRGPSHSYRCPPSWQCSLPLWMALPLQSGPG